MSTGGPSQVVKSTHYLRDGLQHGVEDFEIAAATLAATLIRVNPCCGCVTNHGPATAGERPSSIICPREMI
jgi:hypothetical protein